MLGDSRLSLFLTLEDSNKEVFTIPVFTVKSGNGLLSLFRASKLNESKTFRGSIREGHDLY